MLHPCSANAANTAATMTAGGGILSPPNSYVIYPQNSVNKWTTSPVSIAADGP